MVAAGVRDLAAAFRKRAGHLNEMVGATDARTEAAQAEVDRARGAIDRAGELEATIEELRDELAGRDSTIDELRVYTDNREIPRRTRISEGIYRSKSGAIEAIQIDGENKGKTVIVESLEEARRIRGEAPDPVPLEPAVDPAVAYEAALEAKATELGREPTDEEATAVYDELAKSTAATQAAEEVN
jgi:hypothetical protein